MQVRGSAVGIGDEVLLSNDDNRLLIIFEIFIYFSKSCPSFLSGRVMFISYALLLFRCDLLLLVLALVYGCTLTVLG